MTGIYQIRNVINGHRYVGSAFNIKGRWSVHKHLLVNRKHINRHLQNVWNKYGEQNFIFEVLEITEKEKIISREQFFIDTLKPEYNLSPTAGNTTGVLFSEERRNNISNALKGKCAGVNNPAAKINFEIAAKMREDYKSGQYSQKQLCKKYNVSIRTVQSTLYNKIWKDENYEYETQLFSETHKKRIGMAQSGEKSNCVKLTWEKVKEIREKYKKGDISMKKLSLEYGVCVMNIHDIIHNIIWKQQGDE
jgi:group I intron endonuclease